MRVVAIAFLAALLGGCGDKVPESKAAKELGNVPRQTVDNAAGGVDAAVQKGVDRMKDEDKKQ